MKEVAGFLNPKRIAVIGASDNLNKVGGILMEKLQQFRGEVFPVNPNHSELFGQKCYSSVKQLVRIDLAIIAIPAELVNSALEECGKKRIKHVIVISAGFSERGNKELENKIVSTAEKYSINLLGPNCFGVAVPELNLDSTFANSSVKSNGLAFVSQSGALWSYLSDLDIKFSKFISLGNMAQIEFPDLIHYLCRDKSTKKILLYVERLKNGREFIEQCRKCKKQIFVVKAGKSEKGAIATISHTASLATDHNVYSGVFKQAGVQQISSFSEFFKFSSDFNSLKKSISQPVKIITNAGGAGALLTDRLSEEGIKILEGPIDILGTAGPEEYSKEISKPFSGQIIVVLTPQTMSNPLGVAEKIISSKKKVIAVFLGKNSISSAKKLLQKNKIPVFTQCL